MKDIFISMLISVAFLVMLVPEVAGSWMARYQLAYQMESDRMAEPMDSSQHPVRNPLYGE
jgi:hypothetical protein